MPSGLAQGRRDQVELLAHVLGTGVISDVLAENGYSKLISLAGVELLVGRTKERFVRPGPGQNGDPIPGEQKREYVAKVLPAASRKRTGSRLNSRAWPIKGKPPANSGGSVV